MKKKIALLCISMTLFVLSHAQNPAWIMAPNYVLNGNLLPLPTTVSPWYAPPVSPLDYYTGLPAEFGASGISNLDGNLKFFVVDGMIYDGNGTFIEYAWSIYNPPIYDVAINDTTYIQKVNGNGSDLVIVPHPVDCEKFYLFASIELIGDRQYSQPFFALFDYSIKEVVRRGYWYGNTSDLPSWNQPFYNMYTNINDPSIGGIAWGLMVEGGQTSYAVSEVFPDGSRYIFGGLGSALVIAKITAEGILQYHKRYMLPAPGLYDRLNRSETEIFVDHTNERIVVATARYSSLSGIGSATAVQMFELSMDMMTPYTPPIIIPLINANQQIAHFGGMEFSPNGRYLYFSNATNSANPSKVYYYDRELDVVNPLGISNAYPIERGNIETGVDGNLYFASPNGLYRLTDPNNPNPSNFSTTPVISSTITGNYLTTNQSIQTESLLAYNLPNQIDKQDYSSFFTQNMTCCIDNRTYQISKYSADNSTWNGGSNPIAPGISTVYIKDELRIPAGKTVTIQNMILKFAPGARLIIENGVGTGQGGKLRIMNNTVLTIDDRCSFEEMWLGVEVWGNTTAAQGNYSNSTQGVFRMYGNSRIEHAYVGLLASKRNESNDEPLLNSYNTSHNGAIVIVENSTFYNCHISALFQPYNIGSTNASYFSSTNFIWDGALLNQTLKPTVHLGLVQCTDVRVTRSNFYQNTPDLYINKNERGVGILAFNSGFNVNSSCSTFLSIGQDCPDANVLPSHFKNLHTGVLVMNANNKPFSVVRNNFENCVAGISSTSAHLQNISRNQIAVHADPSLQTWGIYVSNGTGYRIEENHIGSMSGSPELTYGIIVDNSGTTHNKVYKNTLEKLYVGTEAQRINGKSLNQINDGASGLQYICNAFTDTKLTDIGVNGRIDIEQGLAGGTTLNQARNRTARNTFSLFGENQTVAPDHDIMLSPGTQHITYVHLSPNTHIPDNYTTNGATQVFPIQQLFGGLPVNSSEGMCPTYFVTFVLQEVLFKGKLSKIDSLHNIIDGGKKDYLLGLIASAPTTATTRIELSNFSPYLSDEVLEAYINSTASNNNVKTVLIQNSKLSGYIVDVLKYSSRPSNLLTGALLNNFSARKTLLNTIKVEEMELSQMQQQHISGIITDTTLTNYSDNLVNSLERFRGSSFKKSLLAQYSQLQNKVKFEELFSNISPEISTDLADFYAIRYQIDRYTSLWDAAEQDSSLSLQLMNIYLNSNDYEARESANIYLQMLNNQLPEFEILSLFGSSGMIAKKSVYNQESDDNVLKTIKLYPNPSEGVVYFDLTDMIGETINIRLLDITGKEVFSKDFSNSNGESVDLSHIKKGTYITHVTIDEQSTKAQLLILE